MRKNSKINILVAVIVFLVVFLGLCIAAKQMMKEEEKIEKNQETTEPTKIPEESAKVSVTQPPEDKIPTPSDTPEDEPVTPLPTIENSPTPSMKEPDEPTPTAEPKPTVTPTPIDTAKISPTVTPEDGIHKKIVAIDAGHQAKGNSEKEPLGPGSDVMKAKVSSGTAGVSTKVAEYVLNLDISLALRDELETRGYTVLMIRETHDVNLSNRERAEVANKSADIFVRIHANGSENQEVSGALTIYPSKSNEFVGSMSEECKKLAEAIIDKYCEATEAKNRGAIVMDNMSGINWCTIPVTIVEMGYMSNPEEDKMMQDADYQKKMVRGIADGIDQYFEKIKE